MGSRHLGCLLQEFYGRRHIGNGAERRIYRVDTGNGEKVTEEGFGVVVLHGSDPCAAWDLFGADDFGERGPEFEHGAVLDDGAECGGERESVVAFVGIGTGRRSAGTDDVVLVQDLHAAGSDPQFTVNVGVGVVVVRAERRRELDCESVVVDGLNHEAGIPSVLISI